jgi:hypothetical protein
MSGNEDLSRLADRLAIQDVLTRYSRGVDRCDLETLTSAFWEDAEVQYGAEVEDAHRWAEGLVVALKGMACTSHALSNMLIVLDGERATAETYCTAYHEVSTPGGIREMIVGGRYLDQLEKRGGAWRVMFRLYVMDWNRNGPSTAIWDEGMYATLTNRGTRWPDDFSYRPRAT